MAEKYPRRLLCADPDCLCSDPNHGQPTISERLTNIETMLRDTQANLDRYLLAHSLLHPQADTEARET